MKQLQTIAPAESTITNETTETKDGPVAHIVKVDPGQDATTVILEARVNGTPVEALCGHIWVPARDPRQLPVCQRCQDIYNVYRIVNNNLRGNPDD